MVGNFRLLVLSFLVIDDIKEGRAAQILQLFDMHKRMLGRQNKDKFAIVVFAFLHLIKHSQTQTHKKKSRISSR